METKQLGKTGIPISAIGLGAMPLSISGRPSESQAIETIHHALSLGVTLIDTSDAYCLDETDKHHNERLIHQALTLYPGDTSKVVVVTKGGFLRTNGDWVQNGNPDRLRTTIRESFQALGGEKPIDVWLYHAPDPHYPIQESLAAAKEAIAEGLIRAVGVSNFAVDQLRRARDVVDIVAVENQFHPWHRNPEFNGVLDYCEQERLTFLAWSPLGGVAGKRRTIDLEKLPVFKELAQAKGVSMYCIILAWLRSKSPALIPIPGSSRPATIEDSVRSLSIQLSPDEVQAIDRVLPSYSLSRRVLGWCKRQLQRFMP